jgi:hypothetical protein
MSTEVRAVSISLTAVPLNPAPPPPQSKYADPGRPRQPSGPASKKQYGVLPQIPPISLPSPCTLWDSAAVFVRGPTPFTPPSTTWHQAGPRLSPRISTTTAPPRGSTSSCVVPYCSRSTACPHALSSDEEGALASVAPLSRLSFGTWLRTPPPLFPLSKTPGNPRNLPRLSTTARSTYRKEGKKRAQVWLCVLLNGFSKPFSKT